MDTEKTEVVEKKGFVNPFDTGVSYPDFLEALGKKTIADYCKGKLEKDQIEWLEKDLEIYKTK